jgi:HD-GYP domain-containing protein (c-di-GMP phosphodiesterase class II)
VADAYDAMTSSRSYRAPMEQAAVREQIERGRGSQFDNEIAGLMLELIDEDKRYILHEYVSKREAIDEQ